MLSELQCRMLSHWKRVIVRLSAWGPRYVHLGSTAASKQERSGFKPDLSAWSLHVRLVCVWVSFRCSGLLQQSNSKQVWLTCTFTCKWTLALSNPYHSQARLTPRPSLFRQCDRSALCALSQLKELSVRTVRLHVHMKSSMWLFEVRLCFQTTGTDF